MLALPAAMNYGRTGKTLITQPLLVCLLAIAVPASSEETYPIVGFARQGKIPETQWLPYDGYLADADLARAAWVKAKPMLGRQLTWAGLKEQLGLEASDLGFAEGFQDLSAIIGSAQNLFAHIDKGGGRRWLVFEGVYGPLRISRPLVTRWIKTYVTYDTLDKKIIRVTLAIEGDKSE